MTRDPSQPFTLAFVGHTTAELAEQAGAYEDAVLPLLSDHGARVNSGIETDDHCCPAISCLSTARETKLRAQRCVLAIGRDKKGTRGVRFESRTRTAR